MIIITTFLCTTFSNKVWRFVFHARRSIFLSGDNRDLVGKWWHSNTTLVFQIVDFQPQCKFLGSKTCSQLNGGLTLGSKNEEITKSSDPTSWQQKFGSKGFTPGFGSYLWKAKVMLIILHQTPVKLWWSHRLKKYTSQIKNPNLKLGSILSQKVRSI